MTSFYDVINSIKTYLEGNNSVNDSYIWRPIGS